MLVNLALLALGKPLRTRRFRAQVLEICAQTFPRLGGCEWRA